MSMIPEFYITGSRINGAKVVVGIKKMNDACKLYRISCYFLIRIGIMLLYINALFCFTVKQNKRSVYSILVSSSSSTTIQGYDHSYEFLDSGNKKRLEKFGEYIISRSCPAAIWKPGLGSNNWNTAKVIYQGVSGKPGEWTGLENLSENWKCEIDFITFTLNASPLGQVGVFPEQIDNWKWIQNRLAIATSKKNGVVKVLNGFAYTGGSTFAAASVDGISEVVHIDSSKAAVQWAIRNYQATANTTNSTTSNISNSLAPIRWVIDDCMTYLEREIRRGNKYQGLIFDPPAFGRGKGTKTWDLDRDLPTLVSLLPKLLAEGPNCFILLSCHDNAWPAERLGELLSSASGLPKGKVETGVMTLQPSITVTAVGENSDTTKVSPGSGSGSGKTGNKGMPLTCGVFARWVCSPTLSPVPLRKQIASLPYSTTSTSTPSLSSSSTSPRKSRIRKSK